MVSETNIPYYPLKEFSGEKYFTMEGVNFQEGVVGGKMNSEAIGQKVKVVSYGTLNNIFHGFNSN